MPTSSAHICGNKQNSEVSPRFYSVLQVDDHTYHAIMGSRILRRDATCSFGTPSNLEHLELEQKKFIIYCFFSDSLPGKTSTSTSTCALCTFYNILTFMFVAGTCTLRVCGTEGTQASHHRYVVRLEDMSLVPKTFHCSLKTKIYFHNFLSDMSPEKTKTKKQKPVSIIIHNHHHHTTFLHTLDLLSLSFFMTLATAMSKSSCVT